MANVQHRDLAEANLHEPKGVSLASANTVYVATGSGSGTWDKVPAAGMNSGAAVAGSILEADGSGGALYKARLFRYAVNAGALALVAANTTAEQTIAVTGLVAATDEVIRVIKPTHQAGLATGNARITADNQMILQFINNTAAGITPTASETYVIYVWRR